MRTSNRFESHPEWCWLISQGEQRKIPQVWHFPANQRPKTFTAWDCPKSGWQGRSREGPCHCREPTARVHIPTPLPRQVTRVSLTQAARRSYLCWRQPCALREAALHWRRPLLHLSKSLKWQNQPLVRSRELAGPENRTLLLKAVVPGSPPLLQKRS